MNKTTYSVRLASRLWKDDLFNGTLEECVEFCDTWDYNLKDEDEVYIAEILVDEEGSFLETIGTCFFGIDY